MERITDEKICVELVTLFETQKEFIGKIPEDILQPIYNKASQSQYKFNNNGDILNEVSKETFSIYVFLYVNYIANSKEKEEIKKLLKENEYKKKKILSQKYNVDEIFKNKNKCYKKTESTQTQNKLMVIKENNIINKIKQLFKIWR